MDDPTTRPNHPTRGPPPTRGCFLTAAPLPPVHLAGGRRPQVHPDHVLHGPRHRKVWAAHADQRVRRRARPLQRRPFHVELRCALHLRLHGQLCAHALGSRPTR
eukprot:5565445-Prymnesium_polylepis.1